MEADTISDIVDYLTRGKRDLQRVLYWHVLQPEASSVILVLSLLDQTSHSASSTYKEFSSAQSWKYLTARSTSCWSALSPPCSSLFLWLLGTTLPSHLPGLSSASSPGQSSSTHSLKVRAPQVSSDLSLNSTETIECTPMGPNATFLLVFIFSIQLFSESRHLFSTVYLISHWHPESTCPNWTFPSSHPHLLPILFLLQHSLTVDNALGNKPEPGSHFLLPITNQSPSFVNSTF